MTFTIPEFWLGVIATIVTLFIILCIYAYLDSRKSKNKKNEKEN